MAALGSEGVRPAARAADERPRLDHQRVQPQLVGDRLALCDRSGGGRARESSEAARACGGVGVCVCVWVSVCVCV